jgi:Cu/Ag efflux pump CusA
MLASGAGAASRQSIGTTVFGGMLGATILSLVLVPVFYAVIERLREGAAVSHSTESSDHNGLGTAPGE